MKFKRQKDQAKRDSIAAVVDCGRTYSLEERLLKSSKLGRGVNPENNNSNSNNKYDEDKMFNALIL